MKPLAIEMLRLAIFGSLTASILVKVTVTTALALAATGLYRRGRASVRHALLAASFVVMLVLPFSSMLAPRVRVVVPIAIPQRIVQSSLEDGRNAASNPAAMNGSVHLPPAADPAGASPSAVLFGVWLIGTLVFMFPVAAGLWQTRSLRRSAIPWRECRPLVARLAVDAGICRKLDVVLHEAVAGPMTCGAVRPTILLPMDARSWDREALGRALVHEIEHVRRSDWISRCFARLVCAGYWFHPMVWVAWSQFILEAERACDDAVLRRSEATAYADQLVVLAQRLLTEPNQPRLAMASRHDLTKRISALLDTRQRRGRAGLGWMGLACLLSVTLVTTFSPLHVAARIQTPAQPADGRKFEAASVKPCKDEDFQVGNQRRTETSFSPGRITVNCIALDRIVYFAYAGIGSLDDPLVNDSPGDPTHVRGGPGWMKSETYYIEAKAEGTPPREVMMGPMLRALLEERFKLKTHRELEEVSMYGMTVARGGLKIKPIGEDGCISFDAAQNLSRDEILAADTSERPVCGNFTALGNSWKRTWALGGITLSKFANQILSGVLDMHVMDKTAVDGRFNIRLEFGYDDSIRQGVFGGRPAGPLPEPPAGVEPAPSIFTALEEQLGLKLEKTKGPRGFVVIDSAERLSGLN